MKPLAASRGAASLGGFPDETSSSDAAGPAEISRQQISDSCIGVVLVVNM